MGGCGGKEGGRERERVGGKEGGERECVKFLTSDMRYFVEDVKSGAGESGRVADSSEDSQ